MSERELLKLPNVFMLDVNEEVVVSTNVLMRLRNENR